MLRRGYPQFAGKTGGDETGVVEVMVPEPDFGRPHFTGVGQKMPRDSGPIAPNTLDVLLEFEGDNVEELDFLGG